MQPKYDELTKRVFGSETQTLDFKNPDQAAKIINEWIEEQTNRKIKDALSSDGIQDTTSMILVNAIYFMGNWEFKFDPQNTQKYPFNNAVDSTGKKDITQVDMMMLTEDLNYTALPDLDATALRLPYKNSDISMMLIRPNKLAGLPLLEERLKATSFEDIVKKMEIYPVTVYLPRFKIETEMELSNGLKDVSQQWLK